MLTFATRSYLLITILAVFTGCNAAIGDMSGGDGDEVFNPGGSGNIGDNSNPLCKASGEGGDPCEVTADCEAPLVCLEGVCLGTKNTEFICDPIENVDCPGADEACVANICVKNPGACTLHDDCPLGFLCAEGQCQPERDGQACPKPGPGPDLTGTYAVRHTLQLRKGLPSVVDGILKSTEIMRDIVNGRLDLDLPGIVESFLGSLIASIIRNYVPEYAISLVNALGNLSDMLDTMTIEGTMTLQGQSCSGLYRVKEQWNFISFDFQGQPMRFSPDRLPGVPGGSSLEPTEYSGFYSCGLLYFDKHKIQDTMGGLIRYLVDTIAEAATGYKTVEQALVNFVDCYGIGSEIAYQAQGACGGGILGSVCGGLASTSTVACQAVMATAANELGKQIDKATVEMSLIKLKGSIEVQSETMLNNGTWYGSLAGGDFPGVFEMVRQ